MSLNGGDVISAQQPTPGTATPNGLQNDANGKSKKGNRSRGKKKIRQQNYFFLWLKMITQRCNSDRCDRSSPAESARGMEASERGGRKIARVQFLLLISSS